MGVTHTEQYIEELVSKARKAQKYFYEHYTDQHSVDEVVRAVGKGPYDNGHELADEAVEETGIGNIEGKLRKLNGVALGHWNFMKGKKSVGFLEGENPDEPGVSYVIKPLGVIGCVMPSTNPIATVVGNTMSSLKCRNAVIIAPHPSSARTSGKVVELMRRALKEISAPEDLVQCISPEEASIEATQALLSLCDANIATGGAAMVKQVYSSGKPAFGVGQGNCQAIIDEDWEDMEAAVSTIIANRSTDMGVPCFTEQTVHIPAAREAEFLDCVRKAGAFVLTGDDNICKVRELLFPGDGTMFNRKMVGRAPYKIGQMIGVDIPEDARILCFNLQAHGYEDDLCKEILAPVLRYRKYESFEEAVDVAVDNLEREGAGHSSSLWTYNEEHISYMAIRIPVGRLHLRNSTMGRGTGYAASPTIGCGSWGGNSISENLQYYHLMQKTRVTTPLKEKAALSEADWDDWGEDR